MIKERVVFLEDCEVEAQGAVVENFERGKVYSLPVASARRWIRRGLARAFEDLPEPPAKKKAPAKKKSAAKKTAKSLTDYDLPPRNPNRGKIIDREDGKLDD